MVVRIGPVLDPGWLVAAVGVGLEVIGWYQVSGQPTEAQQLPYLASATIPGAALIIAGVVLVAGRRVVEAMAVTSGKAATGSTGAGGGASTVATRPGLWALPDGTYVHRADCPLLDGKPEAYEVRGAAAVSGSGGADSGEHDSSGPGDASTVSNIPSRPCPICEPGTDIRPGPVGTP